MLILGLVRLITGLGKGLDRAPYDKSPQQGLAIGKTPLQLIFNNPVSSFSSNYILFYIDNNIRRRKMSIIIQQ